MVTKRIRSEYMKKFKDPKWDTFSKCYEEMLTYRLTRRLLEHTHNPWFWSGSDSDSDSGGRGLPRVSKNHVGAENSRDRAEPGGEGEETRTDTQQDQQTRTKEAVHRLPVQNEEDDGSALRSTARGLQLDRTRESKGSQREEEESKVSNRKRLPHTYRDHSDPQQKDTGRHQHKTKPSKSTKQTRRSQKVRPAPPRQLREDDKESRHPFALYGSGERDADIAGRKTHSVCPAASTTEIHESALRAKTRREVERQIQIQHTERRRAKSADPNKTRTLVTSEFNPWLTEYMRCYSARTR